MPDSPRALPPVVAPDAPPAVPAVPARASRPVRRRRARVAERHAERQALHVVPLDFAPAPPLAVALAGAPDLPLYDALVAVLTAAVADQGVARPTVKRLAVVVAGLLDGEAGTPSAIAAAAHRLAIGTAQHEASRARRVARLLADPQLDPARMIPAVAQALLPVLLTALRQAHAASIGARPGHAGHHARWRGVHLILDETTHTDQTHLLVIGLAYRGFVLPLGLRTWAEGVALPEGAYWAAVASLCTEVQTLLPPELRDHVRLLADRAYAVPRFFDLLSTLGWAGVLRVQGQTRVQFPDGTEHALRTLVPRPGATWTSQTPYPTAADPAAAPGAEPAADPGPLPVFKRAGWRRLHVIGVWAAGEREPWLLLTSLPPTAARVREYTTRWGIERLFLAWKSHGWNLEAVQLATPARLARLLSGYVVATWCVLAAALPVAHDLLAAAAVRRPSRHTLQLPLFPPARPFSAKHSLFAHGREAYRAVPLRQATPRWCWTFPDWDAPTWAKECAAAHRALAS